ncbi:MAG: helix-turn-helix domain-containing protein [Caulobacteraceae bacterium]|nr:helix-turn-helix domain-containing protein [Caulobacteraceae bacterium]
MPIKARPDDAPHPIDVHVGRKVVEVRKRRGLTQSDLAKATGVTFQQVQKYERGTNRISASRLHQIAEFLGEPVSSFFPADPDAVEFEDAPRSRQAIEIAHLAPKLKLADQKTVLALMRSLTGAD